VTLNKGASCAALIIMAILAVPVLSLGRSLTIAKPATPTAALTATTRSSNVEYGVDYQAGRLAWVTSDSGLIGGESLLVKADSLGAGHAALKEDIERIIVISKRALRDMT